MCIWPKTRCESLPVIAFIAQQPSDNNGQAFDGPVAESVPTSAASFSHRRSRAGSTASFRYFQESERPQWAAEDEEAVIDGYDDDIIELPTPFGSDAGAETEDLLPSRARASSEPSRPLHDVPLLHHHSVDRRDSASSSRDGRKTQKLYIPSEDLTIVIAGFSTPRVRIFLFYMICIATCGMAYLLLYWVPRWRIALLGKATPLRDCAWVVIEVSAGRIVAKPFAKFSAEPMG
jgi:cation-transporting ATPase 13A3/4/5